jgi:hypothetical protein
MNELRPVPDQDRLPWLEPYRETTDRKRRSPRRSHGRLIAYAGALAVLTLAGGGGYWMGQFDPVPKTVSEPVVTPPPRQQPVQVAEAPGPLQQAPDPEPAPPPRTETPAAKPASYAHFKMTEKRPVSTDRKIRTAGVDSVRLKAVRTAQEPQAPPRAWPKMPSPGPAGQVIQLGAFTTPTRADLAYRVHASRHPALRSMPRVVVPVISGQDRRVLYVLRLGTTSREHSKTVCQDLQTSGDHCLVVD